MNKSNLSILFFFISVVLGVICYPSMPDQMVIHWGPNGEPNGFAPKLVGVSFIPVVMLFIFVAVRSQKQYYQKFQSSHDTILNTLMIVLLVIHGVIIAYGYGYMLNIGIFVTLILGILFVTIGNFMPRFRHNYLIGIRTPWSLASEEVWKNTHLLSSRVFFIGGILIMLTSFLPTTIHYVLMLIIVLVTILISFGSSHYYYKRTGRGK
ncbi:SdpI family protein [Brevibacillus sp. BC25]|uniref:SdpI family protein n=1 Tax=unclassified Brevibacillus TaxID=2684853 RepID=UPI0002711B08|nr:SdpI family protein [Brevibacillus sp. BC25]EJL20535.1 putative integral membrane protein [Brevibacillus sp. BC25]